MIEEEKQTTTSRGTQEATSQKRIDPKEPDPNTPKTGLSDDPDAFMRALGKKPKS